MGVEVVTTPGPPAAEVGVALGPGAGVLELELPLLLEGELESVELVEPTLIPPADCSPAPPELLELLFFLWSVPPSAPPSTAASTTIMATMMMMIPLVVLQNGIRVLVLRV